MFAMSNSVDARTPLAEMRQIKTDFRDTVAVHTVAHTRDPGGQTRRQYAPRDP